MKKVAHPVIEGELLCVSGVRIGGSDDLMQIGGTDLICIKHPSTLRPYLPGSSLKGKMRSELEKRLGQFGGDGSEPCGCAHCLICRVFGPHKSSRHSLLPTRIIVRDGQILGDADLELKPENVINRRTGQAANLWKVERVVAGSRFSVNIGIQVWDEDANCEYEGKQGGEALVEFVKDGLREVQKTGLGSGVSKGSGEVKFENLRLDGQGFEL